MGQDVTGAGDRGTCDADIDMDEVWATQVSGPGTVAVVGGGVWLSHPDLIGRVTGDNNAGSFSSSTVAAGAIAANTNNSEGISGMNWTANLLAKKIDETDDVNIIQTLDQVKQAGVRVFENNFRLRDVNFNNRFSPSVKTAFRDLYMDNRILVAPMGKTSRLGVEYPAGFGQGIIAVGASTQSDEHLANSKSGDYIDVAAPGDNVVVTTGVDLGLYALAIGTGIASPHVSGLASLLLTARPDLANDDVEQIIRISADDLPPINPQSPWDQDTGTGRINAKDALALLQLPNRLYHLTAWGSISTTGLGADWRDFAVSPAPGVGPGRYYTEKIEVRQTVTFPVTFATTPYVWGRGAETVGYNQGPTQYAFRFCEPVGISPTGCTLRTFVYRWTEVYGGSTLGWFPVPPSAVQFACTALGQLRPTDARNEGQIASDGVKFSVENPLHRDGSLFVSVSQDMPAALRVYNVAGALVATLHQGNLGVGQHEFRWSGRGTHGVPLPSGLYLAKLETPARTITRKVLVIQ